MEFEVILYAEDKSIQSDKNSVVALQMQVPQTQNTIPN